MAPDDIHAFLGEERTCRLGSVDAAGHPHVSPLWFVWDGTALWLNSVVKSQRWVNLMRRPEVSVVVDSGVDFGDLRGVEFIGKVEAVGDVPQTDPADERTAAASELFGRKYAGGRFVPDGRHAWLRLAPDKIVSWDFRKMPG
jgi:hypothetical protein